MNEEKIPFGEEFKKIWSDWLTYRAQHKWKKYVPIGLKRTFTELVTLSENNEQTAIKMIERAMANNWQGFNFKLPHNGQQFNQAVAPKLGTSAARIEALKHWGFAEDGTWGVNRGS